MPAIDWCLSSCPFYLLLLPSCIKYNSCAESKLIFSLDAAHYLSSSSFRSPQITNQQPPSVFFKTFKHLVCTLSEVQRVTLKSAEKYGRITPTLR